MPIITSNSILSFDTGTRSLLGDGFSGETLSYNSRDDFVVRIDETLTLADVDLFALGALTAKLDINLAFGVIVSASLGSPPNFSTGTDIAVRASYDNILLEAETVETGAGLRRDESGNFFAAFDLSDFEVVAARSRSEGLGTEGTFIDQFGNEQPQSRGVTLSLLTGVEIGLSDVYYRFPLAFRGTDVGEVPLISDPDRVTQLINIDNASQKLTFELNDFFDLDVRIPTGAKTQGLSQGATFVTDKGFSDQAFLELIGDIDLMLTRALGKIPGVGVIAQVLEKTLFFEDEVDLAEFVPFLSEDLFTFGLTVVDISGKAGLKVTERLSVDYGTDGNIGDFGFGGFDDAGEDFARLFGAGSDRNADVPGLGERPNVVATLVSDNGTPGDPTDDRVVQADLGAETELLVPLPQLSSDTAEGAFRDITVDAFYDLGQVAVAHTVGLGGSFSIDILALKGFVGGDIGQVLGISFGPVLEEQIPEGGINLSLVDIFERPFLLEGGSFDIPTSGLLEDADPDEDRLEQLGYTPGDFGQRPAEASYNFLFSRRAPDGFDENSPDALAQLRAFSLAVQERIDVANEVMAEFLPVGTNTEVLEGGNLDLLRDPNYFGADNLSGQFGIWPASTAGQTANVELRTGDGNFLIAAPTIEGNNPSAGLSFELENIRQFGAFQFPLIESARVEVGSSTRTAGGSDEALGAFLDLSEAIAGPDVQVSEESYSYSIGEQTVVSATGEEAGTATTLDDFRPLAINVVGTDLDDVVVYTGSSSTVQDPSLEAPVYLDGAGAGEDRDLFIGDFGVRHPELAVVWDIRGQQLAQAGGGSTSIALGPGLEDVRVGDFRGTKVEFLNADGSRSHETVVRDMEAYVLRMGDQADILRTGTGGRDYIEMGGGDDILGISADLRDVRFLANNLGRDRYALEAGNDLAVIQRSDVGVLDAIASGQVGDIPFFDVISGGTGIDEVLVTTDPDVAEGASAQIGWRIAREGDPLLGADDPDFVEPLIDASGIGASGLLSFAAELAEVLGADDDNRADRNAWSDVRQQDVENGDGIVELFLGGREANYMRLGRDIEEISIAGADAAADLVIYAGGDVNTGGDGDGVIDTFVADFSLWEAAKSRVANGEVVGPGGAVLDGSAAAQTAGTEVFAGANVAGFEQFVVRGTSQSDILVGGALNDTLRGGAGDDLLDGGFGSDVLEGEAGSDVFRVDAAELSGPGTSLVFGETSTTSDSGARTDDDLLILSADPDLSEEGDRGLRFNFVNLANGDQVDLRAESDVDRVIQVLKEGRSGAIDDRSSAFGVSYGGNSADLSALNIERSHLEGTDAHDDALLHDGGISYIGGESADDADLFAADFSNQSIGVSLVIQDDFDTGEGQGTRLDNGVFVSGLDKLVTFHGAGDDTVVGGRLDDFIDGGAGDDILTGAGGIDEVRGGAGDDLAYWEGDDDNDFFAGGDGRDRLMVSNVREDGSAFVQAGLAWDVLDNDGSLLAALRLVEGPGPEDDGGPDGILDIAAFTGEFDLAPIVGLRLGEVALDYTEFEAVDMSGSDGFDDILLYQGGLLHVGGERAGDRDVFAANLSDETANLTIDTADAAPGAARATALQDIGNGVQVAEVEQLVLFLGSGDDRVTGGSFADLIDTGAGRDVVVASLGDDVVLLGAGEDAVSYIAGDQTLFGGADFDRLSLGAQGDGYSQLSATLRGVEVTLDVSEGETLSARRADLGQVVNLGPENFEAVSFRMAHSNGSVSFTEFEEITVSGDDARDILIGGSRGGTLSGDGGDDILISGQGRDFLLGGRGLDRYVFGRDFGFDIISGETQGRTEIHLIGRSLDDEGVTFQRTAGDLSIRFDPGSQLIIRDFFGASPAPQNFVFFDDTAPTEGRTIDEVETGIRFREEEGLPEPGLRLFGSEAGDLFDQTSDGADVYFGFGGDDVFVSSAGGDVFDGSSGRDLVSYEFGTEQVVVDLTNVGGRQTAFGITADDVGDLFVSIEDLTGTPVGDFLHGNEADNFLRGLGGGDVLNGFGGRDLLSGGDGADRLAGGEGNDRLFGELGSDFFAGGPIGLEDSFRDDLGAQFGLGDDFMDGGAGNDRFDDRFGDNTIIGGAGDDTAFAGAGADLYVYRDGSGVAQPEGATGEGSGGLDVFQAHDLGVGSDAQGSLGSDAPDAEDTAGDGIDFDGYGAAVAIDLDDARADIPQADPDTITGIARRDAGAYAPTVSVDGDDSVRLMDFAGVENARGTEFDDRLTGSAADNVLAGGAGDDVLIGEAGNDTLLGGLGEDTADYSGAGAAVAVTLVSESLEELQDTLAEGTVEDGQGGTDALLGIEVVIATGFADTITGGDGRETFVLSGGADVIDGGAGRIDLDLRAVSGAALVMGAEFEEEDGFARSQIGSDEVLNRNLGDLTFGDGDDVVVDREDIARAIALGGGDNELETGAGDQTVTAGAGDDTIVLGAGNDIYTYGGGDDDVSAGDGTDILRISDALDGVAIQIDSFGRGLVDRDGEAGIGLLFSEFERFEGSAGADTVIGDVPAMDFFGGDGDDSILAGSSGDLLEGGEGDDFIDARDGDDTIVAGPGEDTIQGGSGDDVLVVDDRAIDGEFEGNRFDGGAGGSDTVDLSDLTQAARIENGIVVVDDLASIGVGDSLFLTRFTDVEVVRGTELDDRMTLRVNPSDSDRTPALFDGGAGDDTVVDALGLDDFGLVIGDFVFRGGVGLDVVDYSRIEDVGLRVDLTDGSVQTRSDSGFRPNGPKRLEQVENVIGTAQSDILIGDGVANRIIGGDGFDILRGGEGRDTIDYAAEGGGSGVLVDLFNVALGRGFGRDSFGNNEQVTGFEAVIGTAFDDGISGTDGANVLEGGAGNDELIGRDGNDTITDGTGVDTVRAGDGNDLLIYVGDVLPEFDPRNPVIITEFDDFDGGDGIDILDMSGATGGIASSFRTDSISLVGIVPNLDIDNDDSSVIDQLQFVIQIQNFEGIIGSDFADLMRGDSSDDALSGGRGNDTLSGAGGLDTLDGGSGVDVFDVIDSEITAVDLGTGRAFRSDGSQEEVVNFEGVFGNNGDQLLIGNDGANLFNGGRGNDTMIGGDGIDLLDLSASDADSVQVGITSGEFDPRRDEGATVLLDATRGTEGNLAEENATSSGGLVRDTFDGVDFIEGIEDVRGSSFNDFIVGDDADNLLEGRLGDDTLDGGAGNDLLIGGEGADTFRIREGGGVTVVEDFELGIDVVDLSDFEFTDVTRAIAARPTDPELLENGVILTLRDGTTLQLSGIATGDFNAIDVVLPSSELPSVFALESGGELAGSERAESFVGFEAPDLILAGAGDDVLDGAGGDDTLDGGEGEDIVSYADTTVEGVTVDLAAGTATGGAGTDSLMAIEGVVGTAFADMLMGSANADTLEGGGGADTLVSGSGADTLVTGAGADMVMGDLAGLDGDVVTDFGENDMLMVEGAVLTSGDVSLRAGSAVFGFDADGDGVVDSEVAFEGSFEDTVFRLQTNGEGDTMLTTAELGAEDALLTEASEGYASEVASFIDAGAGDDTIGGFADDATLLGGQGDDILEGGAGAQTFVGGRGSDTIETGGGADRILIRAGDASPGAPARDVVVGFDADAVLHLVGFDITTLAGLGARGTPEGLELNPSADQSILLEGVTLADVDVGSISQRSFQLPSFLTLSDAIVVPDEGEGRIFFVTDTAAAQNLEGSALGDRLGGGLGDDTVVGGDGADELSGNEGADTLRGGGGADTLRGDGGADILSGGQGADDLQGGDGDDSMDGGSGRDTLHGGEGDDTYLVDDRGDIVRDSGGFDEVFVSEQFRFRLEGTGVDRVEALDSAGRSFLFGDARATELVGNASDNVLVSGGGADSLTGGDGADFFALQLSDPAPDVLILDFDAEDRLLLDDRFFGLGDGRVDLREIDRGEVFGFLRDGLAGFNRQTRELSLDIDGPDGPGGLQVVATFAQGAAITPDDVSLF